MYIQYKSLVYIVSLSMDNENYYQPYYPSRDFKPKKQSGRSSESRPRPQEDSRRKRNASNRVDTTVSAGNGILCFTLGLLLRISLFHREIGIYFVFVGVLWYLYAFFAYLVTFLNTQTPIRPSDGYLTFLAVFRIIVDLSCISGGIALFVLAIQY